ncbi:GNAT family N-acetyltransferase [Glaciecola sp. MF2-115]|uniref:GNAT family N-acetyltransferase n=1 Tax=Glaciecola sp. MF2-115 TaxID=3384827 RepID=UPI0039A2935C
MNITTEIVDYGDKRQADELLSLLNAYAKDPMGGGSELASFSKQNLIGELKKRPFIFSIICYVDGKPAGFSNCIEGFSTFKCKPLINIHDFAVNPEFRGLQLSQKMMSKIEEIAIAKGCCKITLEVLEGNLVAKNAYIKSGFKGYELDPEMGKAVFWEKPL